MLSSFDAIAIKSIGSRRPDYKTQFMASFQDKLLIWGSAPVVAAWANAMRVFESKPEPRDATVAYAVLLRAFRSELDHDDGSLDNRDLLRLFITDIDEHLPASRAS